MHGKVRGVSVFLAVIALHLWERLDADALNQVGMSLTRFEPLDAQEKSERLRWAQTFAPIIYQEENPADLRAATSFNPIDDLGTFDFENDFDFANNGRRIFSLTPQQEESLKENPRLYFSVMETETYLYLHYLTYRPVDWGPKVHTHDTENIWMIVKKKPQEVVAVVTNSHGLAMIYAPDLALQADLRSRLPFDRRRVFLSSLDPLSEKHHNRGDLEFMDHTHPMIYSCSRTHALYKLNREAVDEQEGTYFVPRPCNDCDDLEARSIRAYQLIDFDDWLFREMQSYIIGDISSRQWEKMFWASGDDAKTKKSLKSLPTHLATPLTEEQGTTSLFFRGRMGFEGELIDPARKHLFLDPLNRSISLTYSRNAYRVQKVPPQAITFGGLWSLLDRLREVH